MDFAGGGVAAIPSFDAEVCRKFFVDHGLAVRAIAIQVSTTLAHSTLKLVNTDKPKAKKKF